MSPAPMLDDRLRAVHMWAVWIRVSGDQAYDNVTGG